MLWTQAGSLRSGRLTMAGKQMCAVTEPATHIDACVCKVVDQYKCNMPDSTCRHRAMIAGSGPVTVQKAHAYDMRLAGAANKNKQQLVDCKTQRPRCPHKAIPVPVTPDANGDSGQTPTGDGPRGDCEIAQQVQSSSVSLISVSANILSQGQHLKAKASTLKPKANSWIFEAKAKAFKHGHKK